MRVSVTGCLSALAVLFFAIPSSAQIIINEIFAEMGSQYDGEEFLELYNPTGSPVDISGWVLGGTEFSGTCGGERFWQFPAGSIIGTGINAYAIVAKGNIVTVPGDPDDGFLQRFGFDPDYETFDSNHTHDSDDPTISNMILLNQSTFNDQMGFIGISQVNGAEGSMGGYGASCATIFNQYEAYYLYDGVPPALAGPGVVIDTFEYRNPLHCTMDTCTGVGTSDNDAFVGLPDIGESVGRDASGTDTNNCSVDLHLGTPTPGAANIANAGPKLSGMNLSKPAPKASESVNVSITATDTDGIGSMYVVFTANGGAADSVSMIVSGPDQYTGTIPAQNDGDEVTYFVRGRDAGTAAGVGVSKYPDYGVRRLRWGTQFIYDVQFHSPATDSGFSNEVGKAVNVEGTVTTEEGPFNTTGHTNYTIQDGFGPFNGIHVIDFTAESTPQRGDSVRVSGEVGEYFGLTQIQIFGAEHTETLGTNRPLPPPWVVPSLAVFTDTTGVNGEALEGVYTRVENVVVTLANDGFGNFLVADSGANSLKIGDQAYTNFYVNYQAALGDSLDAIEGIVDYAFNERLLQPRGNADIQGPPLATMVRYAPLPPTAASAITITAQITDNGTITRAKLYFSTDNGATYDSTDMSHTIGDTYAASVGPYANGAELDYHVEVTDNDSFNGRSPSVGDYDLHVGLQTIATIQGNTKAGSDSSQFEGSPTNVSGIVTMAPGTTADNIFTIQNHWALSPAYSGVHVYSGGSLVGALELGDSVTVCGDVDEFNGLTEIRMHFADAYVNHGQVGELPGFELNSPDFMPDSTGALPDAEAWEGVLIQFNGSRVTSSSAGFGQYFIDNTSPLDGLETLVDDESRYGGMAYGPTLGDMYTFRGIGWFSFGEYKLQPRDDTDVLPFNPGDAVGVNPALAAVDFGLAQNSPNPFGGSATRITFAVPRAQSATLRVFDVQGRLVRTLVNGPVAAGLHTVDWNGRNDDEREVAAGVYFYRLEAGEKNATRKMILLR